MEKQVIKTEDGSLTVYSTRFGETYHSRYGAIAESRHVFIEAGFREATRKRENLKILELGLGTCLNALLTAVEAQNLQIGVEYWAYEAYPLSVDECQLLNYPSHIQQSFAFELNCQILQAPWGKLVPINPCFSLLKLESRFEFSTLENDFDLVYFDAFAPATQPELWTEEIFVKVYQAMAPGGILTTYCAKGSFKRALKSVGFLIEALPGPAGKREMTKAVKP